jgi:hypothetical protein
VRLHAYERSPHSGAGNCGCGMAEHSPVHPHAFMQASGSERCVCGYTAVQVIHTGSGVTWPKPVPADGLARVAAAVRAARGGDPPARVRGYA